MKVKTSVTLSEDLLRAIDEQAKPESNRSEYIESVLRSHLRRIARERQNARDQEIINQMADSLNEEALDVLSYQVVP